MLEPYDGKLSRTVLRREGGGNTADPADYADDRGHEEVGAVPGEKGSAGHERIRRPSVGYRAGQVPQDHADHCHSLAGKAPETGSPAERQRTGQGESAGFGFATAKPIAGRADTAEAICPAYRRKVRKLFSIIV